MKRYFQNMMAAFMAVTFVAMPAVALAQLTPEKTGLKTAASRTGLETGCTGTECLTTIIGNTINVVLGFLGVVLLAMLLFAGWKWMTAGGDMKQVQEAKTMIFNAIAGMVIIAASYAISTFVLDSLSTITSGGAGGDAAGGGSAGSCTVSADCSDPLATCEAGVCTSVVGP